MYYYFWRGSIIFLTLSCLISASPIICGAADVASAVGVWNNSTSNGSTPSNFSGGGTNEIHWGFPTTGNNQSGYNFNGNAPPTISNVPFNTPFAIGTFT